MTGSRDQPQNLSLVQTTLLCSPDEGDRGTMLPVGFNDNLPWELSGDSSSSHFFSWHTDHPFYKLAPSGTVLNELP